MVGSVANNIATDLNMPPALTNWLLAGWALAATLPVIIVGKISDIFGRRWVMIAGNASCLLGCVSGFSDQLLDPLHEKENEPREEDKRLINACLDHRRHRSQSQPASCGEHHLRLQLWLHRSRFHGNSRTVSFQV